MFRNPYFLTKHRRWTLYGQLKTALQRRSVHLKVTEVYNRCYRILGVDVDADQSTVRQAYLDLVKKYHPDAGSPDASAERFYAVDEAFKLLQGKFAKDRHDVDYTNDMCDVAAFGRAVSRHEEEDCGEYYAVPQHRQYLTFDGIGAGNPFERQKQYQQTKIMTAKVNVFQHRLDTARSDRAPPPPPPPDTKTLVCEEQQQRKLKKRNGKPSPTMKPSPLSCELLAEQAIQEAMEKGLFSNLPGSGKPLSRLAHNRHSLDPTSYLMNQILIRNGLAPTWIDLRLDIRNAVKAIESSLRIKRRSLGPAPLTRPEAIDWQNHVQRLEADVRPINQMIRKYNLIAPIVQSQLFPIQLESLAESILEDNSLATSQKHQPVMMPPEDGLQNTTVMEKFVKFLAAMF